MATVSHSCGCGGGGGGQDVVAAGARVLINTLRCQGVTTGQRGVLVCAF